MKFINYKYFHWLYFAKNKKFLFSIILTVFFWLFLSIAQPFGINSEGVNGFIDLTLWILPISTIWIISIYICDFLFRFFTNEKDIKEYKFDALGWVLKLTLIVHLILIFRGFHCSWECIDLLEYFQLWFACVLLFSIVYIPFSIYAKLQYYKVAFTNSKMNLNEFDIEISTLGKHPFIINTKTIIYFKSDDNYIDAFSIDNHKECTDTFRATMKSLESDLQSHPQFLRIHRSYIVNLNYYTSFNSNQVVLKYDDYDISLPVSRKYKPDLIKIIG